MTSEQGSATGMPRWVKVFGLVTATIIVLFLVVVLVGFGGPHGPGRHLPPGHSTGGGTSSKSADDRLWS